MASNKFASLFVTATALLLLATSAAAARAGATAKPNKATNPLCNDAAHQRLCSKMVGAVANNHDATVNSVKALQALVKEVQNMEPVLLSALSTASPAVKKTVLETCQKDLKQKSEDLETVLKALKAKDMKTVIDKLTAGTIDNCYIELQKNKKRGFDSTKPYFKKAYLLYPEFNNALALAQKN